MLDVLIVDDSALLANAPANGFEDRRFGVSAMLYPQPFGLQAEWNWGDGPAMSLDGTSIGVDSLDGDVRATSVIVPCSVNFTAFDSRLSRICRTLPASVSISM